MLDEIIGGNPTIQRIRNSVPLLAQQSTPLILIGEAGVGKSLFASHIHALSKNNTSQLEVLNFSITSEKDQRVKLFGAEPPELTTSRKGIMEIPTTVILKHVQFANGFVQSKLAEALNSMNVCRWSGSEYYNIKCRIIFTFRTALSTLVKKGKLPAILFDVLKTAKKILIPPLREREEDIPLIAEYYFKKFQRELFPCSQLKGIFIENSDVTLSETFINLLKQHSWTENIRDMKAFLRGLFVLPYEEELCQQEKLELMKMITRLEEGNEFSLPESIMNIERGFIERTIEKYHGKMARTAQMLGLTEGAIRKKRELREPH